MDTPKCRLKPSCSDLTPIPETSASLCRSSGSAACASRHSRARLNTAGSVSRCEACRLIAWLRLCRCPVRSSPTIDFAQRCGQSGRQIRTRPATLCQINQVLDLALQGASERRAEIDMRVEFDRANRLLCQSSGPGFDLTPIHQQDELRAIVLPDHFGRQRGRQQRGGPAGTGLHFAAGRPDRCPAADRHLQQEEAVEAARIDRYRTAIGHIVHRETVKRRAIMQRMEIGPGMPQRIQRVRTKYPADQFGGLADICGVNTGIGRKPRDAAARSIFATAASNTMVWSLSLFEAYNIRASPFGKPSRSPRPTVMQFCTATAHRAPGFGAENIQLFRQPASGFVQRLDRRHFLRLGSCPL